MKSYPMMPFKTQLSKYTLFAGIVQERLRYVPLGWAKYYEFNESDLRVACDTLDTWIDATAMVIITIKLTS